MTSPRLARWLLERCLDEASAEAIVGDLSEEFRLVSERRGATAARRWFWRQAIASVASRRMQRRPAATGAPGGSVRRAGFVDGFSQDLRFSFRTLASAPAFA